MDFDKLLEQARSVLYYRELDDDSSVGGVASALLSGSGRIFTGVCVDIPCGIGFCAEHAAIAAMITAGETRILKIVAINEGGPVAPCGRCREFINLIHPENLQTEIMLAEDKIVTLREILPFIWDEARRS